MMHITSARGTISSETEQTESTFDKRQAETEFYKKIHSKNLSTEPEVTEILRETNSKIDKIGQRS